MADEEVDVEAMLDESLKGPAPGEGGAGGEKRVREEEGSDAGEDKRRRERSRDRDRDKGRDRDRSRRDKSRSRSRSRSRRDRDRDRDRDRGRDRDRDRAKRDRRRDRRSPSPPLTAAERLKREQERELAELERDLRTVFVYQLHPKAPLKDIFKLFSQAGKVADIRIITDRYTGRSKGFGYVEYADKMSILPALALNGQLLAGHPVLVKPSESEKNAAAQLAKVQAAMSAAPNPLESQLRISNVHKNVRERDLEDIFSPFGKIEQLEIQEDAAGGDLGMAAVQFTNVDAARKAMQALNGLELAGATIVVTTAAPYSGASAVAAAATGAYQQTVDVGEIDDDGKTGLALNASARAMLMQKLQRPGEGQTGANAMPLGTGNGYGPGVNVHQTMPGGMQQTAAPAGRSAPAVKQERTILLRNMFAPEDAKADEDFEQDMKEDITGECAKYGRIEHVKVDKNSMGLVYLKFEAVAAGAAALNALNGRWFAGKMITAEFYNEAQYNTKFGLSS